MQFLHIVGHDGIKQRLVQSAQQGRVSHAQLFCGADGYGTLALALAYAQYLNCEQPSATDSCGLCPSCKKYQTLQHPDLHFSLPVAWSKSKPPVSNDFMKEWREFATNNNYPTLPQWYEAIGLENKAGIVNVAEAEAIIGQLAYKAYEGKFKVQVLWHAENMNTQAANKLLKLIEEPSEKTLLLLVVESTDGMLKTILSRTQQIAVPPIDRAVLAQHLAAQQGLPLETATEYARMANGNYVEALNWVQQSDDNADFYQCFVQLMRLAYGNSSDNVLALLEWSNKMYNDFGREQLRQFFVYALRLTREVFAIHENAHDAVYLNTEQKEWGTKFSPFVNESNVAAIYREFDLAGRQISANGNARIILITTALTLMKLIKQKV
ncbi:DNA polymerase III subunit delta [Bacteroidia bacterium]|nr:DNA polymerase III subunit delta [Bacteroidia bacterium]